MKAQIFLPSIPGYVAGEELVDTDVSGMAREKLIFVSDNHVGELIVQITGEAGDPSRYNWVNVARITTGQRLVRVNALGRYMRIRPNPEPRFLTTTPPQVWVTAEAASVTQALIDTPFQPGGTEFEITGDALDVSTHGPVKSIICAENQGDAPSSFRGILLVEALVEGIPEVVARFDGPGVINVIGTFDTLRAKRRRPAGGALGVQPQLFLASTTEGGGGGDEETATAAPSVITFSRTIAVSGGTFSTILLGSVANTGGLPLPACSLQNLRVRVYSALGSEDGLIMTAQNISRFPVPYIQNEWAPAGNYADLGPMVSPHNVPIPFSVGELLQIAISGSGMSGDGNLHVDGSIEVVAPTV